MIIKLKNQQTKLIKEAKLGFSWTTLFFGIFVPLFRGDLKWGAISLLLAIFTAGISWFIFPFFYNKVYIKDLLKSGYVPINEKSWQAIVDQGWMAAEDLPKEFKESV